MQQGRPQIGVLFVRHVSLFLDQKQSA